VIVARLILIGVVAVIAWVIVDAPAGASEIHKGTVTSAVFISSKSGGNTRVTVRDNTGTGIVWTFSTFGTSIKTGDIVAVSCRRRRLSGLNYCDL
jgi:hypothetical protein